MSRSKHDATGIGLVVMIVAAIFSIIGIELIKE